MNPIPTGDPSDEMFEVELIPKLSFDAQTEEILLLKPLLKTNSRLKRKPFEKHFSLSLCLKKLRKCLISLKVILSADFYIAS